MRLTLPRRTRWRHWRRHRLHALALLVCALVLTLAYREAQLLALALSVERVAARALTIEELAVHRYAVLLHCLKGGAFSKGDLLVFCDPHDTPVLGGPSPKTTATPDLDPGIN